MAFTARYGLAERATLQRATGALEVTNHRARERRIESGVRQKESDNSMGVPEDIDVVLLQESRKAGAGKS